MDVSVVLKNVAMTTGEGPHWDDRCQSLYYVDVQCGDVHKWDSITGEDTKVHTDGNVGFAIPRKSGGLIVGQNLSICHLDWDSKAIKVIAEDKESKAFQINDAKCDVTGRLWAGSMQKVRHPLEETPQRCAALYSLETDGRLVKRLADVSLSNGLTWSPDNAIFYYIDSIPRKIYAFDFDPQTGDISNQQEVRDGTDGSLGLPDGMTIDTEGKLWVVCYGEGKLVRIDPETGKTILDVLIPNAKMVTSCCFGGKEMNELFVTSRRYGLSDDEFQPVQPLAGSVFKVTGQGIKGLPAYMYEG
ncbi:regucalcin-like isoform X1 [Liolophura sinensis]|uniref:regucalcin-like isoform X1 n=1 Tax=Liolophura sinensis TaxID=3198878 RepID=UPI00315935F5